MNTRRLVLHLIVGLLTFLLGVAIAVALGSLNPFALFSRTSVQQQHAIPAQSLSAPDSTMERPTGCRYRMRMRTAELHSDVEPPPAAPVAPVAPIDEDDVPPPPPAPRAKR